MKPFDSAQGRPGSAPEFWRTLEEQQGANLDELVGDEFASRLPEPFDAVERRSFLKLMGASLALAGMAGCTRQPPEQILPYVRQPENVVPGRPLFYATAMTLGGRATGLLVESHEGRPTKIEGNPSHPAQPRRDRCLRAGGAARSLRSRSHANADAHGRNFPVVGVHRRDAHGRRRRSRRPRAPAFAS